MEEEHEVMEINRLGRFSLMPHPAEQPAVTANYDMAGAATVANDRLASVVEGPKPSAGSAGPEPAPEPAPDITAAIAAAADQIAAKVDTIIEERRRMSLLGKMKHLTEEAAAFNKETSDTLDEISEKIAKARSKRDAAREKHHAYYDGIIRGVDESIEVIDRLSNGPLEGDGTH